jgi:diacylglycerol kinase family enzyme
LLDPSTMLLFLNPGSGDDSGSEELRNAAEALGVVVVELRDDFAAEVERALSEHPDVIAIGMAGGDGSLALVAAHCVERDLAFVCVPFGTRNHFARDLGLERDDPIAALSGFVDRSEHLVDVGWAGTRMFLNNVTFGVYAEVIDDDDYRDAKVRTTLRVTRELLGGDRDADSLQVPSEAGETIDTPFALLISNNCYETLNARNLGVRRRLDEGVLQIWALEANGVRDLASVARAAVSSSMNPEEHPNVESWTASRLELTSPEPEATAGVDGEAVDLPMPLTLTLRPGALRVWTPEPVAHLDDTESEV